MNTDHPDSRRTASEINELNRQQTAAHKIIGCDIGKCCDESPRKPAAWLHVEASKNGWSVFVRAHPHGGTAQPDYVFNNVFDCARKIADLLQPTGCEPRQESDLIAQLAQQGLVDGGTISGLREDLIKVQAALELMATGRDDDAREHQEAIKTYQERVESLVAQVNGYQGGCNRLKQQRNEARAEAYVARTEVAQLRSKLFPADLQVDELKRQLECACKQRDEMMEHADRNRAGRITAENHIRRLQAEMLTEANRRAESEAQCADLRDRVEEAIKQRDHAINRWREDNRLAEQRLARIRTLESEISELGKQLQNRRVSVDGFAPMDKGLRACVDGQLYTIDDLCKEHSELKTLATKRREHIEELLAKNAGICMDIANLRTENRQYSEVLKGEVADRTRLIKEVQELTTRYSKQAEFVGAQWKLGFDAGCERVMKYVSAFSKEIAESIARNSTPSNPS